MLIVIALGGNALLQPNEALTAENLIKNSRVAAEQIAKIAEEHQVLLVHGNGPQVGLLALQAEAYHETSPYPFDILDAESQGMVGYVLQQSIKNTLPKRECVTILTQVLVDIEDHDFLSPSKPIGPFYKKKQFEQLKKQHPHWHFQSTSQGFRRLIASPSPIEIIEISSIKRLLENNSIVIAGGGGGIPCAIVHNGIRGIEAVIDKDLTASLLACLLSADQFVILTNIDAVYTDWGTKKLKCISETTVDRLSKMDFELGSMQPKIDAVCQFATTTKHCASIGHLSDLEDILKQKAGTHIYP